MNAELIHAADLAVLWQHQHGPAACTNLHFLLHFSQTTPHTQPWKCHCSQGEDDSRVEARQRKAKKRQPTQVMAIKQDVQVRYCQHWVSLFFPSVENRDF